MAFATPNRNGYKFGAAWEGDWGRAILERVDLGEKEPMGADWNPTDDFAVRSKFVVERLGGEFDLTKAIKANSRIFLQTAACVGTNRKAQY